ncbi:MAG: NYN domain-containing protein [Lachnospiraceae bacterium]|jgi:small GTP-binding protein
MGKQEEKKKIRKRICVGLLAHVDAGKTTLSESILYLGGSIRKMGRVDDKDAFLDTFELERARGITIFSKQAMVYLEDAEITLLDTPGHVDFSAEMERTLQVLDYAVLVISGADGVQGHTQTLWRLLERYQVPVFLFINKMDQPGCDREALLEELKRRLDDGCIEFDAGRDPEAFYESLAMCEEALLEQYLETGELNRKDIVRLIAQRKVFPCYFGSALKLQGIEELLQGLRDYTRMPVYPDTFGARVYKIARDDQGNRLTYMKITGGCLKVKDVLTEDREKADQIRIYSGSKYEMVKEALAGTICAVTGLSQTQPGAGLGMEEEAKEPVLEPVLTYQILLPQDCDVHTMLLQLRQLEEEEPQLHIIWEEQLQEIHAQVMGEVQIEILKSLIAERFGVSVEFGAGNIVYKETIAAPVEGVGHYEPLRHYAEVHLLLEPLERGSGLVFASDCDEDILDRNWQRLILTHLAEREHKGVLTGSPVTDMKITLLTGRAHLKHTEGGDFRQATYRAVRQGLKKAESILLEPYYEFRLEVPAEMVGRAMSDVQRMSGSFEPPYLEMDSMVLEGFAPVAGMQDYQAEVISYTRGRGRLFCMLKGYEVCHNAEEVIERIGYDPERDLEHPTGSVFCSHGAGFVVNWDEVEQYMHIQSGWEEPREEETAPRSVPINTASYDRDRQNDEELKAIFERTYGPVKPRIGEALRSSSVSSPPVQRYKAPKKEKKAEEYLLVDGYNIIFAWDELKELAEVNMDAARSKLQDILCNYQGYKKCTVIVVFDAYKLEGYPGEVLKYHNIYVVFTKEAETADQYIEKTVHAMDKKYRVTVATSDGLEQVIILGQGANLLSAREFKEEVEAVRRQIREEWHDKKQNSRNYLFHHMSDELAEQMEEIRLGRKKLEDV